MRVASRYIIVMLEQIYNPMNGLMSELTSSCWWVTSLWRYIAVRAVTPSSLQFANISRPIVSTRTAQSFWVWRMAACRLERDWAWYCKLPHCSTEVFTESILVTGLWAKLRPTRPMQILKASWQPQQLPVFRRSINICANLRHETTPRGHIWHRLLLLRVIDTAPPHPDKLAQAL